MGSWLVIGFFVVLALGILAVAMSSGPRRRTTRPGGRWAPGTGPVIAAIVVVFGLALPAWVLFHNGESQARDATGGVELTASQETGRELFKRNCATCHTLADASAVGRVGPSLDALRPPVSLTVNAIALGRARGQGQMPSGLLDAPDSRAVADYVAAVAGR